MRKPIKIWDNQNSPLQGADNILRSYSKKSRFSWNQKVHYPVHKSEHGVTKRDFNGDRTYRPWSDNDKLPMYKDCSSLFPFVSDCRNYIGFANWFSDTLQRSQCNSA